MGRRPCCAKEGINRGAWTAREDKVLTSYIQTHGEGKWRDLPQKAGLNRCGKSCRLRWLNYLRPDIKRGNISLEEEELIVRLHKLLGNRWSLIAGRLPGRTDNEIKNYWNTNLSKRSSSTKHEKKVDEKGSIWTSSVAVKPVNSHQVIRTKARKCSKVVIPWQLENEMVKKDDQPFITWDSERRSSSSLADDDFSHLLGDFNVIDLLTSDALDLEFNQENGRDSIIGNGGGEDFGGTAMSSDQEFHVSAIEALLSSLSDGAVPDRAQSK
ncbi:hypothetical protein RJ639_042192 [Escallonia herrerae]|uniref:Uncharacterized protein n=1 Tax=Escallonia herrerae TaxID=1293975 RepID=A0AA88WH93_9ASTE|nr:hypothetical protein RJ639_042192 [Escallonia herrerae]